jgi:hypothetical protein
VSNDVNFSVLGIFVENMQATMEDIIAACSLIFEPEARHIGFRLSDNTKLE